MTLQKMREELRRKYERLRKEEERLKTMLKYYEPIESKPLHSEVKRKFLVRCKHCGEVMELKYAPSHARDVHGISLEGRKTEDDFIILGWKSSSNPKTERELTEEDRGKLRRLCQLQDQYLEKIPKTIRDTDYSTSLGVALECNMDVLREVACRIGYGMEPHAPYISEKIDCVINYLERARILEEKGNPTGEVDTGKAEHWIELLEEVIFAPGLDRTERARRSLNLFYETAEHLKLGEFTKFVRRWRELTASLAEPLTARQF